MNKPTCKNGKELLVGCGKNSQNPFNVCEIKSIKSFLIAIIFWYKYTMENYSKDGMKVTRRRWYYLVQWFENFLLFTTLITVFFGTPTAILNNQPFFDLMNTYCIGGIAAATILLMLSVFFDSFHVYNAN